MTNKNILRLDWATYAAAKFACVNWHYSKSVPVGKIVKIGVWESGTFIGVILFSRGANRNIGSQYGLKMTECCELTRVALTKHVTHVSRVIAIAIIFLKRQSPGIRLIVSYADTAQGHCGGIYRASNFIFCGSINQASTAEINGKVVHKRTISSRGIIGYKLSPPKPKHKYLFPLDDEMRRQIAPLSKIYTKLRTKEQDAGNPPALGGVTPTRALQFGETIHG